MTKGEQVAIGISIVALGVGVLALSRREVEIKTMRNVEKMLEQLKVAYRFSEIVEHYHETEGENDDPDNSHGSV